MLTEGQPELVLAFMHGPSVGTSMMIDMARRSQRSHLRDLMMHPHLAIFLVPVGPSSSYSVRYVLPNGVIYSSLGACGNVRFVGSNYVYLRNWCLVPIGDRI